MTFNSEYLGLLASQAPREEVETEVRILAGIFGVVDQGKVDSVTPECMTQGELAELRKWNRRLDANTKRDRRGEGARLFWAAQALASTVTSTSAFDQAWENPAVAEMMSAGADGLFEVGRPQFLCLAMTVQKIISWCLAKKFKNIGVIESPLGNSLPAEILRERGMAQGLTSAIVAWTLPRNDNPSKGRTIRGAARELVEMTTSFDVVLYRDDASTGTR